MARTFARHRTAPAGRPAGRITGRLARHQQQVAITLPEQRTETDDTYTWMVNAAVESGRTDLAYELATAYPHA